MAAPATYSSDEQLRDIFARLGFVTSAGAMTPLLRKAFKAASASDVTILLEGETGTGKQILAYAIHQLDQKRRFFPFITAHCSSITEALAESEFFGHHRGAFTSAVSGRTGLFQAANHGTLFLDDVSDLPPSMQPKLLDVIQRGVLRPVGSDREHPVNVRFIAASNQPLKPLVLANRFRMDLYYRLNVIRLGLPPLRDRSQDLPKLVLAFAERYAALYKPIISVEPELLRFLEGQAFPGNVRELENTVVRMLFAKDEGSSLELADWLAQAAEDKAAEGQAVDHRDLVGEAARNIWEAISRRGLSYPDALQQVEKQVFEAALQATRGDTRRQIARRLGTSERTLYHKLRAHHLGAC